MIGALPRGLLVHLNPHPIPLATELMCFGSWLLDIVLIEYLLEMSVCVRKAGDNRGDAGFTASNG